MIRDYQRAIISGLAIESFNPGEINKRFEIFEKVIPAYKHCFTKKQLGILRLILRDMKQYQKDGCTAAGLSEISIKAIIRKFPYLSEELEECLSAGPITECMIEPYLKILENKMLEI